jgi:hypothetical protein
VHETRFTCVRALLFDPAVIWNNTALLAPLKMAETTIQPEADDRGSRGETGAAGALGHCERGRNRECGAIARETDDNVPRQIRCAERCGDRRAPIAAMAAAVAPKVSQVVAAAPVTEAGTVSVALVLVRVTVAPPVGAGWVRVTLQEGEELGPRIVGLQTSDGTSVTRVMVALRLLRIADIVAANIVVVAPPLTVTEAGRSEGCVGIRKRHRRSARWRRIQ